MKFQLIIDEESEEVITARVKKGNDLTTKIETLVKEYVGESKIVGFTEDETIILLVPTTESLLSCKVTLPILPSITDLTSLISLSFLPTRLSRASTTEDSAFLPTAVCKA